MLDTTPSADSLQSSETSEHHRRVLVIPVEPEESQNTRSPRVTSVSAGSGSASPLQSPNQSFAYSRQQQQSSQHQRSMSQTASNEGGYPRSGRLRSRRSGDSGLRLPLVLAFLPQLLIMVAMCILSIVIYMNVYRDAARVAADEYLSTSLALLGERVAEPFIDCHSDAMMMRNLVQGTDADLIAHHASYNPSPNISKFQNFLEAAKALLIQNGDRYNGVLTQAQHPERFPNGTDDILAPVQTHPYSNNGCTHDYCAIPIAKPEGKFDLMIFDIGWESRYPAPVTDTPMSRVVDYRRFNPSNRSGNHAHWSPFVVWIPYNNKKEVFFVIHVPLTFDADGYFTSNIDISLKIRTFLDDLKTTTNITMSNFAILDLDHQVLLQSDYESLSPGYNPGVISNDTATQGTPNMYLEDPSLITIDEIEKKEPNLWHGIQLLRDKYGGSGAAGTNASVVDMDLDSRYIISCRPVKEVYLNLLIIMFTDKEMYDARLRDASFEVIVATACLISFAVIVGILTAIAIRSPINKAADFVKETATLALRDDSMHDIVNQRSIFKEVAELQDASTEMAFMLDELKGYVPHTVLQGYAATDSDDALLSSVLPTQLNSPSASVNPLNQELNVSNSFARSGNDANNMSGSNANGSGSSDKTHISAILPTTAVTLNFDRVNAKVNQFRPVSATMLLVQLVPRATALCTSAFSAECQTFMNCTIPHILKARGVIELQRPDQIVVTFDRGVHAERAAMCALKISKSLKRHGFIGVAVLHTGTFLSGACGAQGRNAFVIANDFFRNASKLAELSQGCLKCSVLATDAAAKNLPVSIATVPVDCVSGISNEEVGASASRSIILYEVLKASTVRTDDLAMVRSVFSFLVQGQYKDAVAASHANLHNRGSIHFTAQRLGRLASFLATGHHSGSGYERLFVGWSLTQLAPPSMPDVQTYWDVSASKVSFSRTVTGGDADQLPPSLAVESPEKRMVHSTSSDSDDEVDHRTEVRKAMASHSAAAQQALLDNEDGDSLFPMALVDTADDSPASNNSPAATAKQNDDQFKGFTRSQNRRFNESSHNELDTNVPVRFVDIQGNTWMRAPGAAKLGEGAFSKVYTGMNGQGDIVALKCMDMDGSANELGVDSFLETEVAVLAGIYHPNLTSFISLAIHRSFVILIMEYVAGGTLRSIIQTYKRLLPRNAAKRFALDILNGLSYLHDKGVAHGDVKPENVLIGADSVCKLTDFGSAVERKIVETKFDSPSITEGAKDEAMMEIRGTAPYMAPEVARGDMPTPAADVWSFGVLMHELIHGELPWAHENGTGGAARSQIRLIRGLAKPLGAPGALRPRLDGDGSDGSESDSSGTSTDDVEKKLSHELLRACLAEDPEKRPSVRQLSTFGYLL